MTRSGDQFETPHDDGEIEGTAPTDTASETGANGPLEAVRAWVSFHRVECCLTAILAFGVVVLPVIFGLGDTMFESGSAPTVVTEVFGTAMFTSLPVLVVVLGVHAAVDIYRVGLGNGEPTSTGRILLRSLQTTSALAFVVGVYLLLQAPETQGHVPDLTSIVSLFLIVASILAIVVSVASDGLVRLYRGTW